MKTIITIVTPLMASNWLKNNPNIRNLRPRRVAGLVRAILQGEFKTTHQGIAINQHGELIDGQHRLAAIVASGLPVRMMVTTDIDNETLDAIDGGLPRTAWERLRTDKLDTHIASALLSFLTKRTQPQGFEIELCLEIINPILRECEISIKGWRSKTKAGAASALAAMTLLIAVNKNSSDLEEMKKMMSQALTGDIYGAPQSVINYYKQMMEGVKSIASFKKGDGASSLHGRFCRAWIAMQPKNKDSKILLIRNTERIFSEAEKAFSHISNDIFK